MQAYQLVRTQRHRMVTVMLSTVFQGLEEGLRFCICSDSQVVDAAGLRPLLGSKALDYTTLSGAHLKYVPLTVRGLKKACLNTS